MTPAERLTVLKHESKKAEEVFLRRVTSASFAQKVTRMRGFVSKNRHIANIRAEIVLLEASIPKGG